MDRNYNVKNFISKSFTLERSRVAKFADIVKMATIFIKTTFKDSNKVKEIRNFVSKCNLYLYFLIQQNTDLSILSPPFPLSASSPEKPILSRVNTKLVIAR